MAKTNKRITKSEKNAISWVWEEPAESWYEVNRQMDSWRTHTPTKDLINKIRAKMVEWAQKDDSEYMESFLDELNIPSSTYDYWRKKFPELQETHVRVMNHIGRRREYGARKGGDSASITMGSLGHFWRPWKMEQEYKEYLRAKMALFVAEHKHELDDMSSEDLSNCFHDWIKKEEVKIEDNAGDSPQTRSL
jgi:hypothetical protein